MACLLLMYCLGSNFLEDIASFSLGVSFLKSSSTRRAVPPPVAGEWSPSVILMACSAPIVIYKAESVVRERVGR